MIQIYKLAIGFQNARSQRGIPNVPKTGASIEEILQLPVRVCCVPFVKNRVVRGGALNKNAAHGVEAHAIANNLGQSLAIAA